MIELDVGSQLIFFIATIFNAKEMMTIQKLTIFIKIVFIFLYKISYINLSLPLIKSKLYVFSS